jgi:hypothetical protein
LSHGGDIVPRSKFEDRERYIKDLKSLGIFDAARHGWLEKDYEF